MEVTDSTVTFPDGTVWDEDETTCGDDERGRPDRAGPMEQRPGGRRRRAAQRADHRGLRRRAASGTTASTSRSRSCPEAARRDPGAARHHRVAEQPHRRHRGRPVDVDHGAGDRSTTSTTAPATRRHHHLDDRRLEASMRGRPGRWVRHPPPAADPHDPEADAAGGRPADRRVGGRRPGRRGRRRGGAGPRLPARACSARRTPTTSAPGRRLRYAVEPEPLDTAGAIRFAADLGRHRGAVRRGQRRRAHRPRRRRLVAFHDEHGAEGTIALHQVDDPSAFGVVPTDDDGRVLAFVEKPPPGEAPTDLINAGTYVLEPSVLERIAGRPPGVHRAGDLPGDGGRRHAVRHRRQVASTGPTPARRRSTSR